MRQLTEPEKRAKLEKHWAMKNAMQERARAKAKGKPAKARKPIARENPERKARRQKAFRARLSRADWRALRLACFARDGFQCVNMPGADCGTSWTRIGEVRCEYVDESRTGKGLVCDHLTYSRFGHENLDDLRTLCRSCNARATRALRANHANGFQSANRQRGV